VRGISSSKLPMTEVEDSILQYTPILLCIIKQQNCCDIMSMVYIYGKRTSHFVKECIIVSITPRIVVHWHTERLLAADHK